jgi:hypothetical protein
LDLSAHNNIVSFIWSIADDCLRDVYVRDKHAKTYPYKDDGEPVPMVNSPRVGMCGYVGPAEPPY